MKDRSAIIMMVDMFGARLPGDLAFSIAEHGAVSADHPLAGEIAAALDSKTASLPYLRKEDDMWVTLAPTAEELLRVIEDLRSWLFPSLAWESTPSIISEGGGSGRMGALLLAQSPQGYLRWHSRPVDRAQVVARLAKMRTVLAQAPVRQSQLRPTLEMLRRQFTLGLATGNRDTALQAIDEIDQRQLDTASNALSMRIRLASAFGDNRAVVEHPQLDDLLSMRLPQRVVESVVLAHHAVFMAEYEAAGDIEAALAAYKPLHNRLAGLVNHPADGADTAIVRMAAYDAALAEDTHRLGSLTHRFLDDPVISALALILAPRHLQPTSQSAAQPVPETDVQWVEPPLVLQSTTTEGEIEGEALATAGPTNPVAWTDIPALVAANAGEPLTAFLKNAALMPDAYDPGDGDFVIELFTDSNVLTDTKKSAEADRILTTLIDAYVCEERFPRRERITLYQAVLDVWLASRALSTDPIDGQLLLTMADALLRLDGGLEHLAATAITRWWEARAVRSRLAWLGEAIELLTEQSVAQDYLALWYAGARLIKVDHEGLSFADRHLWHRLGRRLGLDEATTGEALGGNWQVLESASDPLVAWSFKKIAIVSLNERAAREAAAQIASRTNAQVIVVTDHAAGEATASAATADVILFVWGATKHAVYRAFDKVRDRLEYVQGTGSSSIVRALERRVRAAGT